ncbi:MAG TPA: hypothetical protein VGA36_00305, partial [Nitriliruptorales bacterium]
MAVDAQRTQWVAQRIATLGFRAPVVPERPRTAVVGVDGGEPARDAAAWAGRVASEVHLVAALGRPRTLGETAPAAQEAAEDLWS